MAGKKLLLVNSRFPFSDPESASAALPFAPEQNASLHAAFLKDTVLRLSGLEATVRIVTPSEADQDEVLEIMTEAEIRADVQAYEGETGGDVLAEAVQEGFNTGMKQILVVDSAVPTVPLRIIQSALSLLEVFDDAFTVAPIERGGFYAAGMNGYHSEVLRGVKPDTQDGYETLIGRICEFDSSVYILQSWYDVRQAEDIVQLQGEIASNFDDERGPENTRAALEEVPVDSLIPQDAKSEEK